MTSRPYSPADYPMLSEWWRRAGWTPIPPDFLKADGVIVNEQAAGWIYKIENNPGALIEWIVANPDNTPEETEIAVNEVLRVLIERGKEWGAKVIQSMVYGTGLQKVFEKQGFIVGMNISPLMMNVKEATKPMVDLWQQ